MGLDNPIHILLLLVVVLLVFGAKRLPEIGRSLGDGMRGFKDSLNGGVHHAVSFDPPADAPNVPQVSVPVAVPVTAVHAVPSQPVDSAA
jgi:sec-independent protein translocase protein TatA